MSRSCSRAGAWLPIPAILLGAACATAGPRIPESALQNTTAMPGLLAAGPELTFVLPQWSAPLDGPIRLASYNGLDAVGLQIGRQRRVTVMLQDDDLTGLLAVAGDVGAWRFGAGVLHGEDRQRWEDDTSGSLSLILDLSTVQTAASIGVGHGGPSTRIDVAAGVQRRRAASRRQIFNSETHERRYRTDWEPWIVALTEVPVSGSWTLRASGSWEDRAHRQQRAIAEEPSELLLLEEAFSRNGVAWEAGTAATRTLGPDRSWTAWTRFRREEDASSSSSGRLQPPFREDRIQLGLAARTPAPGGLTLRGGIRWESRDFVSYATPTDSRFESYDLTWAFRWGVSRAFGAVRLDLALLPGLTNGFGDYGTIDVVYAPN